MSIISKIAKFADKVSESWTTKTYINSQIIDYGKVLDLVIDSKNKSITISALLKGEENPISINVEKYEVKKDADSAEIKIINAGSNKEWLDAGIRNFINGKSFDVPKDAIDFVDDFLE